MRLRLLPVVVGVMASAAAFIGPLARPAPALPCVYVSNQHPPFWLLVCPPF
jgi:hypothetical protein